MGTRGVIRENEGYNCMPLFCCLSPFSNSILAGESKRKKGLRGNQRGLKTGSPPRPNNPVAINLMA